MRSFLLLLVAPAILGAAAPPSVELLVPRAAHTATLLPSGEVLVVGGCAIDSCELDERGATTEVFDPAGGRFRSGPGLSAPRVGHVAAGVPGGRVLIAGGWTDSGLARSAEVYDPTRKMFAATGSMTIARGGAVAVRLRDGRVLVAGGTGGSGPLPSAEVYDVGAERFSRTGSMATARGSHTGVVLRDGRVLVIGGSNGRRVLASTEIYDPRRRTFSPGPRLITARQKHASVLLRDGSVLVVGGSDERDWRGRLSRAEVWIPGTRRFVPAGRLAEARFKLGDSVVRLADGRVVVAGGGRRVEVYDPRRRTFAAGATLGPALAFATATPLRDGSVLVAGGYDETLAVNRRAWRFRPD